MTATLTDAQLEQYGYKPGQFDEVRKQIARNRLARMRRSDDTDTTETADERHEREQSAWLRSAQR